MNNYFKAFIVGSSYPVFLLPFYLVSTINKEDKNFTYQSYTFIAPIYIATLNVISVYLMYILSLSNYQRYSLISIISAIIVCLFSTINKVYNYSSDQWIRYYIGIFIMHFILYFIIIQSIENLLC